MKPQRPNIPPHKRADSIRALLIRLALAQASAQNTANESAAIRQGQQ